MRKTLLILGLVSASFSHAQKGKVGVNTENPTASLQVKSKTGTDASTKNLELTNANNAQLVTVLDNGNVGIGTAAPTQKLDVQGKVKIVDGTQGQGKVLTSDANGVAKWEPINQAINNSSLISITTIVDPNILGYVPSNTATASSAASTISVGNTTARKLGTYTYGGHTYATYLANNIITWYDAYFAAKELGGYLATFTSDEEWMNIETNMLSNDSTFDAIGAWIGMAKFDWHAGSALQPNPEMKWITGEQPKHDYSAKGNHAVRKSNWFAMKQDGHDQNEPNNGRNQEGFVHTWPKNNRIRKIYRNYTSTHPWNDVEANVTNIDGSIIDLVATGVRPKYSIKAFIVEFQQ